MPDTLYNARHVSQVWPMCNKGITVLPATHTQTIPLLPSRKASRPFGLYSSRLPTKGWPGWVDLSGWSHTKMNVPHRELNPDTVTHRGWSTIQPHNGHFPDLIVLGSLWGNLHTVASWSHIFTSQVIFKMPNWHQRCHSAQRITQITQNTLVYFLTKRTINKSFTVETDNLDRTNDTFSSKQCTKTASSSNL